MQLSTRILLIYDRDGSEFCYQAHDLKQFSPPSVSITAVPVSRMQEKTGQQFDVVAQYSWGLPMTLAIPRSGFILTQSGIKFALSDRSAEAKAATSKLYNRHRAAAVLPRAQFLIATRDSLYQVGKEHCAETYCCYDGVNTSIYRPQSGVGTTKRLRVGWIAPEEDDEQIRELYTSIADPCRAKCIFCVWQSKNSASREQFSTWLNSVDVLLNLQTSGDTSSSVLAAMACGRPVVSTHASDIDCMLQSGRMGAIVEKTTPAKTRDELVKHILFLESSRPVLREYSSNAVRHAVRKYGWEQVAPQWVNCLLGVS